MGNFSSLAKYAIILAHIMFNETCEKFYALGSDKFVRGKLVYDDDMKAEPGRRLQLEWKKDVLRKEREGEREKKKKKK